MRNGGETTIFKFASHGMNHGHFDRLNMFHYDGTTDVLTDYGAARFVNVKAKEGGRYLPENDSYAKQTVAHNTVVVNEKSQFNGEYKKGKDSHAELLFSDLDDANIEILAAKDDEAYAGVQMKRIVAQVQHPDFSKPLLIDVFMLDTDGDANQYDLPFHFRGQVMSTDYISQTKTTELKPLAQGHGYQHLWLTARGTSDIPTAGFTWMEDLKFYSLTTVVDANTELLFTRTGANDPAFNLRTEPTFIVRQKAAKQHTFASVLESHGQNNPSTEKVTNQEKMTQNLKLVTLSESAFAVFVETKLNHKIVLLVDVAKDNGQLSNKFVIEGDEYQWDGNYKLITK